MITFINDSTIQRLACGKFLFHKHVAKISDNCWCWGKDMHFPWTWNQWKGNNLDFRMSLLNYSCISICDHADLWLDAIHELLLCCQCRSSQHLKQVIKGVVKHVKVKFMYLIFQISELYLCMVIVKHTVAFPITWSYSYNRKKIGFSWGNSLPEHLTNFWTH